MYILYFILIGNKTKNTMYIGEMNLKFAILLMT